MTPATPPANHTALPRRGVAALLAALTVGLASCASAPTPADYARETPKLDLREYFNGEMVAHGIFTDRSGKVVRRFTVVMDCRWSGEEAHLHGYGQE